MSTKTNFKRIALVAVAALGLGVLSSVPSQAVLTSSLVTVTNGTDTTRSAYTDTLTVGTQATVNIRTFADAAYDSFTVQLSAGVTKPGDAGTVAFVMNYKDTANATTGVAVTKDATPGTYTQARPVVYDTVTSSAARVVLKGTTESIDTAAANAYLSATFGINIDNKETTDVKAGTYTGSLIIKFYDGGALNTDKTQVKDFSIVVSAPANQTLVADASQSTAVLSGGTTAADRSDAADSTTVSLAATAGTAGAVVRVWLKNYAGNAAQESLTVTTDRGNIAAYGSGTGSEGTQGKSLVMVYNTGTDLVAGYKDIRIYGDGTAGAATITIKSTSVTFANKNVTFYATSVASIAKPTVLTTVIGASASSTNLLAVAKDSNGNIAGSAVTLYAYSSDTTLASDDGSSCTFNATLAGHVCSVTGVKAGSPTFIVRNKSTVALSTVSSVASDAIRISVATPATVKIAFDKATYAPNEKATITVSVLDSAGLSVAANTFANTFATGGITANVSFGNGSDTLTNVSVTTATDVTESIVTPVKTYTVYMPASGGTVTLKATGGASMAAAGQVAVTASAAVTDNAAAALAAVTALATTVASLKTLITTLTNLVLKIQKKVKA
jgi:hypothetical protein